MLLKEKPAENTNWSFQPLPVLSEAMFLQWQKLLEERTGMRLTLQSRSFLQTNIGIRMRELGLEDHQIYFDQVSQGMRGSVEWLILVDRLTVKETSFIRHPDSFSVVSDYIKQHSATYKPSRPLQLWSVGCSTGEEAYSLAMVAEECLAYKGNNFSYGVTGTDISQSALVKARSGLYEQQKLRVWQSGQTQRFFVAEGQHYCRVAEKVRQRVCFARVNMLDLANAPFSNMDVIYCQNVLIYFRRWRRREILNHLCERLTPGGILVLGLGEVVDWENPQMKRYGDSKVLAYKKIAEVNS